MLARNLSPPSPPQCSLPSPTQCSLHHHPQLLPNPVFPLCTPLCVRTIHFVFTLRVKLCSTLVPLTSPLSLCSTFDPDDGGACELTLLSWISAWLWPTTVLFSYLSSLLPSNSSLTHTQTQTCTHTKQIILTANMPAVIFHNTFMYMHACTWALTYMCIHVRAHTRTHWYTQHVHTHTHTHTHTHILTYTHACTHTHTTHIYTHWYTHMTRIHTPTHTLTYRHILKLIQPQCLILSFANLPLIHL